SPQIIISGASSPICVGGTATLSASGVNTYSWSTGSNAQSIVVSPASSTTYTISGSLFPACASTAAITLSVNLSVPSITASASSNSVCLGNTVSLSGAGALTYTWSGGVQNAVAFSPTATAVYTVTGSNACGNSSSTIQINLAPLLIGAVSTSSLICSGSTATLTAAGASTYTWSPGSITGNNVVVSPIVNTVYTVQGTLGACLGSTNIAINTNPLPNLSVSASSSMICAGTSATLTASGGISYTWQPGGQTGSSIVVSPSIPTAYIVSGSNSFGCSVNLSQAVITNPSPTVSAVTSNSQICSGASATLTASGASTYSWSNGSGGSQITVSPVSTTLYSVTGTDANTGCSNTSTLLVNVFEASISVSQNTAICIGQSVSLNASGATSYTWSNGQMSGSILISPSITSVFVVNATSTQNGMNCASSGSVQVTVNPLPLVTAVSTRTNICRNESTIIQASGASGYLWSNSAVSPSISVSPTITTTYSVTGTDANGCTNSSSIQIKVFNCVGIYEFQTNNRSTIFVMPNPSGDSFTLKSDREETLEIVNTLGQTVRIVKLEASGNFEIRVGGLSGGTYLLRDCESKIYSNTRIIVMN
ncbi:MAG TPA: T9SS type A sorting domain-containing protein, partial [Bacteroidia bacterium]|nr:T9SS type A sorting domain-containing protein [Bacteroidia bacterium]